MSSVHILCIEDDPDQVMILEDTLDEVPGFECTVHAVSNTGDAQACLQNQQFDLIIADNRMPAGDEFGSGSNFLNMLIEQNHPVPMMLVSGAEPGLLHERTQQHIANGEIAFLHKDAITASVLEPVLRSLLAADTGSRRLQTFMRPVVPFEDFEQASRQVLRNLQSKYGFKLAMMTRVVDDQWVVVHAEDCGYGISDGDVLTWSDSFCSRMVEGRGPMLAPDATQVPTYRDAPVARELDIASYLGIPICRADGTLFGTVCAIDPEKKPEGLHEDMEQILDQCRYLATVLEDELRVETLLREKKRAELESKSDGLTGLYNRRGWDMQILAEEDRCRRYGHPGAVMIIDLDGLKEINDRDGHEAGDELISRAAQALSDVVRGEDVVARLGGDEFAILAVEAESETASALQERVRAVLAKVQVDASIGLASREPDGSFDAAVKLADERMYEEKRQRKGGAR